MKLDAEGMKLSIYIPALKRDALFDRCLRSVNRSIVAAGADALEREIVVVEGVSPVAEARNEGLRRTTGEWIVTVDSDDEVTADWFSEICRAIAAAERDGEIDDIVFDMVFVKGSRETVWRYGRGSVVEPQTLVVDLLRDMRMGSHSCRHVMRRRLWDGDGYDRLPVWEDYVTLPRVLMRARKIAYLAKPLYRYIIRKGSLSNGVGNQCRHEIFKIAMRRAESLGGAANVGAMVCAYNILYDGLDHDGQARRWIRRHFLQALCDREVPAKWKLKFALASIGVMVRRPR